MGNFHDKCVYRVFVKLQIHDIHSDPPGWPRPITWWNNTLLIWGRGFPRGSPVQVPDGQISLLAAQHHVLLGHAHVRHLLLEGLAGQVLPVDRVQVQRVLVLQGRGVTLNVTLKTIGPQSAAQPCPLPEGPNGPLADGPV